VLEQKRIKPLVLSAADQIRRHLGKDISALYLRGSAARDDWVFGLSDVDLYLIVRDDPLAKRGVSKSEIDAILQSVSLEPQISCRVVRESYLRQNHVGSYLTGLDARLLLGDAVLEGLQAPTLDELRDFGLRYLEYLDRYWKRSKENRRSSLLEEVRRLDYMVLKSAQTVLTAHGIVALRKDEVAHLFQKKFGDLPLANVVGKARDIRSSWPEPASHPHELSLFVREADSFLSSMESYLKMRKPTPNSGVT